MKHKIFLATLLLAMLFTACKEEFLAPDISGMETADYVLNIGDKLTLAPNITNLKGNDYGWYVNEKKVANATIDYTFTATTPGTYIVVFKASNKGGAGEKVFKILVEKEIAIAFENTNMTTPKLKVLEIKPNITGPDRKDYEYEWAIGEFVIGKEGTLDFIELKPGDYNLTLKVSAGKQSAVGTCKVKVEDAEYNVSPITFFDFRSAPGNNWLQVAGQAGNVGYPPVEILAPYNEFIAKATENLRKTKRMGFYLNSWGSYVMLGFDHSIINIPLKTDLKVSVDGYGYPNLLSVYVAQDKNKNGKPDDEWFEIKNVDYGNETVKDYERTYTLLKLSAEDVGNNKVLVKYKDEWVDNQVDENNQKGKGGFDYEYTFDNPSYGLFPGYYLRKDKIEYYEGWPKSFTLKGKLFNKKVQNSWASPAISVNINDAVNHRGEPANINYIDFVKVQRTGEVYLEDGKTLENIERLISGIVDLHSLK